MSVLLPDHKRADKLSKQIDGEARAAAFARKMFREVEPAMLLIVGS